MTMPIRHLFAGLMLLSFGVLGCQFDPEDTIPPPNKTASKSNPVKKKDPPSPTPKPSQPDGPNNGGPPIPKIDASKPVIPQKGKMVGGNNVFVRVLPGGKVDRKVFVNAYVCMNRGPLELFLCRERSKEHEAILAAKVDARTIHTALMAVGAKPGLPVQFLPKYKAAHGDKINVSVQYKNKKGKIVTARAQDWIRDSTTVVDFFGNQYAFPLQYDWVFGGSKLFQEPGQPPYYAANDGTVICISNFDMAMMDLPVQVSEANAGLFFEAWTERIPPLWTPVLVILEPVAKKAK